MNSLKRLFAVEFNYTDLIDHQRARWLLWSTWAAAFVWLFVAGLSLKPLVFRGSEELSLQAVMLAFFPPFGFYVIYRDIQNGSLKTASRVFVALTLLGTLPISITPLSLVAATIPLIAAGMLLERKSIFFVALIELAICAVSLVLQIEIASGIDAKTLAVTAALLVLDTALLVVFNQSTGDATSRTWVNLENIRRANRFGEQLAARTDENAILVHLIEIIRGDMKYSYAQVYLLNDEGHLSRYIRAGLGVKITGVAQQLRLSDSAIISESARTRTAQTATLDDPELRRGHFLPGAIAGVAIPICYQDTVIGVLDVQSETRNKLTPADVITLELLANQTAMLIIYARSRTDFQAEIAEYESAAQHLRERLHDLQPRGRTSNFWSNQIMDDQEAIIGFDLLDKNKSPVLANDLPNTLRPTLETGEVSVEDTGRERIVNVPIMLHDAVMGAMSFAVAPGQVINERQLEMLEAVSTRLALSLEARYLYERSQAQALRETRAGEVAGLLLSATDVRTVLNLAAESFNETLGAVNTRIYLKPGFLKPEAQREEAT